MAGRPREGQSKSVRDTDEGRFGQRLEMLLEKSGLTVKDFADQIEMRTSKAGKKMSRISTDAIYLWLKGTNQPPYRHWRTIISVLNQHLPHREKIKNLRDLAPDTPLE